MGQHRPQPLTPRERAMRAEMDELREARRAQVDLDRKRANQVRALPAEAMAWLAGRIDAIETPPFDPYAGSGKYKGD